MGVAHRLRRYAFGRPHLLLVEGTGGTALRLDVERFSRERGWPQAASPADADVLVEVGDTSPLASYVVRVWDQLPGPRARAKVAGDADLSGVLERARESLGNIGTQAADVRSRKLTSPEVPTETPEDDMGGHDMGGHDMGGPDMGGHDMGGMEMPAGLAMADRAPDRDGLKLDVLTVPWGPVLSWWPQGLVVTTVLQGDVVQEATVERIGQDAVRRDGWAGATADLDEATTAAVVRLDTLVSLLGVAGWDGARLRCQQARDALLHGHEGPELARLAHRIGRSRGLARMTHGLPTTGEEDVTARYRRWLREALTAVFDGGVPPSEAKQHAVQHLGQLLTGTEVASMRLIVAGSGIALSDHEAGTPDRV